MSVEIGLVAAEITDESVGRWKPYTIYKYPGVMEWSAKIQVYLFVREIMG